MKSGSVQTSTTQCIHVSWQIFLNVLTWSSMPRFKTEWVPQCWAWLSTEWRFIVRRWWKGLYMELSQREGWWVLMAKSCESLFSPKALFFTDAERNTIKQILQIRFEVIFYLLVWSNNFRQLWPCQEGTNVKIPAQFRRNKWLWKEYKIDHLSLCVSQTCFFYKDTELENTVPDRTNAFANCR